MVSMPGVAAASELGRSWASDRRAWAPERWPARRAGPPSPGRGGSFGWPRGPRISRRRCPPQPWSRGAGASRNRVPPERSRGLAPGRLARDRGCLHRLARPPGGCRRGGPEPGRTVPVVRDVQRQHCCSRAQPNGLRYARPTLDPQGVASRRAIEHGGIADEDGAGGDACPKRAVRRSRRVGAAARPRRHNERCARRRWALRRPQRYYVKPVAAPLAPPRLTRGHVLHRFPERAEAIERRRGGPLCQRSGEAT